MLAISPLLVPFFRLLNLAVFAGLAWYVFKKYLKNRVEEKITQREALLKGLEERGNFLQGKVFNLENRLRIQEARAQEIKQRVQEWNIQVLAQKNRRAQEYALNAAKAAQRMSIKNSNNAQQQWRAQIVPQAIHKISHALAQQFANPDVARSYVQEIVCRLESGHG